MWFAYGSMGCIIGVIFMAILYSIIIKDMRKQQIEMRKEICKNCKLLGEYTLWHEDKKIATKSNPIKLEEKCK